MKIKVILPTTGAIAIAAFFFQKSQIEKLNQEQDELKQTLAAKATSTQSMSANSQKSPSFRDDAKSEQLENIRENLTLLIELNSQIHSSLSPEPIEDYQKLTADLVASFAHLTHQDVLTLIPAGPYDFDKVEDEEENIDPRMGKVLLSILMLTEQNPKEALLLLREIAGESKDSEQLDYMRIDAFRKWISSHPAEANAWYEKELATGATDLENFEGFALSAKALESPADAIQLALTKDDPKAVRSSLYRLDDNIKDLAGHRRFLAGLNLAQESNPNSEALSKFRASYLHGLNQKLPDEHFKDAAQFVSLNYNHEDLKTFIEHVSRISDLAEPAKWASWLTEFGDQKSCTQFVAAAWGMKDPEAVGQWLEQQPESPLKQLIIIEHAFQLALTDKAAATQWAQTLPDSKRKQKLLRQIEKR